MKSFFGKRLISHEGINLMTGSNEIRLQTEDGVKIALFDCADHCQSAAHAINNHDALVELLVEFRDFAVRQGWRHVLINKANKIIEEEKS